MKRTMIVVALLAVFLLIPGCTGSSGILSAFPAAAEDVARPEAGTADLQELIDKAEDEGEVIIKPGTYTISEPLKIENKKKLSIKGEGNVTILGENIDRQIFMISGCENIRLENIRARHKSNSGSEDKKVFEKRSGSVVDIEDTGRAELLNCELEGCGVYGIYAVDTEEIDITGCYVHHNSWMAFGFHAQRGVMNVSVNNCTVTNNADFVEKEGSVNIQLNGQNVIKFNNAEGYKSR